MKINLMFLGENPSALPQVISANEEEVFRHIISKYMKKKLKNQEKIHIQNYKISTLSANIPLDKSDLKLSLKKIEQKYGNSFSIKMIPIWRKSKIREWEKQRKGKKRINYMKRKKNFLENVSEKKLNQILIKNFQFILYFFLEWCSSLCFFIICLSSFLVSAENFSPQALHVPSFI